MEKSEYNKNYYSSDKPYPVRLHHLKIFVDKFAADNDTSRSAVIRKALEFYFQEQLMENALLVAARYMELIDLIKLDYTFKEALVKLNIDRRMFNLGITPNEKRQIEMHIRISNQRLLEMQGKILFNKSI